MAGMEGLGRLIDIGVAVSTADMHNAAVTGKYCSMRRSSGVTVVFIHAVGSASSGDPVLTLKESKDASGTGAQNLAVIGHYYKKVNTALTNGETWTKVDNTSGGNPQATITAATGEGSTDAAIWAFEVSASQLDDGYPFIRVDTSSVATASQYGTVLYLPHDLEIQRTPANLQAGNV